MLEKFVVEIKEEVVQGNYPPNTNPQQMALTLIGTSVYPVLMPYIAEMLTGEKPDSAKFIAERQEHIKLLVRQLEAGAKTLAEKEKAK